MKNTPTWTDITSFIKDNVKFISGVAGAIFLLFAGLMAYDIYSTSQGEVAPATDDGLTQEEIEEVVSRYPDQITPTELNQLEETLLQGAYYFSVFIENEDQDGFTASTLLKNFLITEEAIQLIEEKAGTTIEPLPRLAVNVDGKNDAPIQNIVIGTGDEEANKRIADAYLDAIKNDEIPLLANKNTYFIQTESVPVLTPEEQTELEAGQGGAGVSLVRLAVLAAGGLVFSILAGVTVALLRSFFQKEVTDLYGYVVEDDDTVLRFNQLRNLTPSEREEKMVHAILYPTKQSKLVLSEKPLSKTIANKLALAENDVVTAADISDTSPKEQFDEVFILAEKNETTKNWYTNQRLQLQNYDAEVKIIQY